MKNEIELEPNIRRDENFLAEICPGVWVMDDHRWAFYAWEYAAHKLNAGARYTLIHADYHYDGCNDFGTETDIAALRAKKDLGELEAFVRANDLIKKDSFIAPAVIRELLGDIHFYCLQTDTDPGIDDSLLSRFGATQRFHSGPRDLVAHSARPLIYDLCLDLFNRSDQWEEGDLWSDQEIDSFLQATSHLIKSADIVTVSLSHGYSGSEDDTKRLAWRVLPTILGYRGVGVR